jgi:hypothetical protein
VTLIVYHLFLYVIKGYVPPQPVYCLENFLQWIDKHTSFIFPLPHCHTGDSPRYLIHQVHAPHLDCSSEKREDRDSRASHPDTVTVRSCTVVWMVTRQWLPIRGPLSEITNIPFSHIMTGVRNARVILISWLVYRVNCMICHRLVG